MQSCLAGEEVAVHVMIGQLFRKHTLFVHPAAPYQMKRLRILIFVLQPASIEQYSLQPEIFRVEYKDLIDGLDTQSPPIFRNQIVEILALAIDDEVYIGTSLLIPFFITGCLDLSGHLTFILNEVIRVELGSDDVCTLMEH